MAVIFCLIGLWFLTGGINQINIGDILTVITSIMGALHIIVAGKLIKSDTNPLILNFQQFVVVCIGSGIVGLLLKDNFLMVDKQAIFPIFYLAIFASLFGYVSQFWAQKYITSLNVSLIFALEPVFGALFAWTLGNEAYTLAKIIGGIMVIIGVFVSQLPESIFRLPIKINLKTF